MTKETGGKNSATARRLRQLRKAEGYTLASAFAAHLGITAPRLSNFEAGLPLSIDAAKKIVAKVPGMSLDWLYFGKEDALPLALRQRLASAAENATTTAGRSKGA
jgi:transcriptional regulator with XRE-family HTH domain